MVSKTYQALGLILNKAFNRYMFNIGNDPSIFHKTYEINPTPTYTYFSCHSRS